MVHAQQIAIHDPNQSTITSVDVCMRVPVPGTLRASGLGFPRDGVAMSVTPNSAVRTMVPRA